MASAPPLPPGFELETAPAAPRIAPQPIIPRTPAPQTPGQVVGQDLNNQRTGQQIQQSSTGGVNYSDERSMRSAFEGLPDVRNYHAVLPVAQAAHNIPRGGAGDLDLVYAFAKVMDPGSVVREGEVQMSENTGGVGDRIRGYLQGLRNGQRLPENVRQGLLQEIDNRVSQYRAVYQQIRKNYYRNAERYRFDPEAAVGPDIGEAFEPGPNAPPQQAMPQGDAPIDLLTDTINQLQIGATGGPPPGSPERFRLLQNLHNARRNQGDVYIGTGDNADEGAMINQYGATRRQMDDLEQEYQRELPNQQAREAREQFASDHPILAGADTVARTIANTVTAGYADRLAGGDPLMIGANPEGVAQQHAVTASDWQNRPLLSLGGTMVGGALVPYGTTLPRQIGAAGAYSGLTGFNETEGPLSNRLSAAFRSGTTGAGINAGFGGLARAFRSPNADAILEAGARQNITIPRYMLGRETAQVATGAVGATPGRIPLARAARDTAEGIENARNRAAAQIGDVGDNLEAGRRAQSGARQWLDETEQRGAEHFDRVPIHADRPAELTNTRAVLADTTRGLNSNPELSAILEDPQLIRFRDALNRGGLSWGDMKQFRSAIGRMIGRAQVASEGTHVQDLRALYAGLTQDMEATAAAQGPRALSMFRRANQYWRGREARREGIITDILGRNMDAAPEDTYRMINRWAQRDTGNTTALAQTMRSLPRADADAVRATIFARMGRATRGQQDETGEAFSPFVFATQWAGLEPRAKALLVPNRAHRQNLEDIALLATSMRRSERFMNTSNTGLGANLGMFSLGGWLTSPGAAAGAAASTYMLGRLLSSPAGSATLLRALRNPESFSGLLQGDEEDSR